MACDLESIEALPPHLAGVRVEHVSRSGRSVRVAARTTAASARCPDCGTVSRRVHSRYERRLLDTAAFSAVDSHAWDRIMRWLRSKYSRLGMPELRRRFCVDGTWQFAANGVRLTGASAVPVTRYRYRYRGSSIPTPWAPQPVPAPG